MFKKTIILTALFSLVGYTHAGSCSTQTSAKYSQHQETGNIVSIAQSNAQLSILVEAVVASGLADTLANTKNITVFAPTNAAFADLLAELNMSKQALLANKALLTKVLTYHVVSGKIFAKDVSAGRVKTLQGESFKVKSDLSLRDANGRKATFVANDVKAANGVVHLIDKVILPKM